MGPHWCAGIMVSKLLLPVTSVNYKQWGIYSNRGRTQRILKVIRHNPRQGFLIRHVTLFHSIFLILTATNCCVRIKIHFTTITTSIYLNTMHEQLTFISSALHCCDIMCGVAQTVSPSISSVPHHCGTYISVESVIFFSVPVLLSGVPHYCDGTCMWSSWQCHLLSVLGPLSAVRCTDVMTVQLTVSSFVSTRTFISSALYWCDDSPADSVIFCQY